MDYCVKRSKNVNLICSNRTSDIMTFLTIQNGIVPVNFRFFLKGRRSVYLFIYSFEGACSLLGVVFFFVCFS